MSRFDFKVSGNWQPKQETMAWTQELYETLRQEMGLSQGDFDTIRANREQYTDERLRQAIAYTRFMAKKSNIANIPRYFMTTLENEYRVPGLALEIEAEKAKQLTASAEAASRNDVARERSSASTLKASQTEGALGLQAFALIVEDEQRSLFGAFTKTPMFQVVAQATGIPAGELTLEATMKNATASEAFGLYVYQWAKKAKSPARKSATKAQK